MRFSAASHRPRDLRQDTRPILTAPPRGPTADPGVIEAGAGTAIPAVNNRPSSRSFLVLTSVCARIYEFAMDKFIRRFLIHVLPKGFHRIRHYGLLASGNRAANIAHARQLLAMPSRPKEPETPKAALDEPRVLPRPCPCCGGRMIVIETFARGCEPKHRPTPPAAIRVDTS